MVRVLGLVLVLVANMVKADPVSKKWDSVQDPSFCVGYSIIKMEQHPGEVYYEWMKEWYDAQISNDDLMMNPVNSQSIHDGYNMNSDERIIECVTEFDKVLEG